MGVNDIQDNPVLYLFETENGFGVVKRAINSCPVDTTTVQDRNDVLFRSL